jgi:hypothetical protein
LGKISKPAPTKTYTSRLGYSCVQQVRFMAQYLALLKYKLKNRIMKNTSTKATITLRTIGLELKAILENDIRKFTAPQYINNKNAAFLQFIAA